MVRSLPPLHNKKANFILGILTTIVCSLCLGFLVYFYNLDAPDENTGRKKAEQLLIAIQIYKEKTKSYPYSLDSLTPVFISAIPKPNLRQDYCYDLREDGQSFTLAFVPKGEAIGDGWYVYSSKLDKWTRVDSDFWQPCHFFFDIGYDT